MGQLKDFGRAWRPRGAISCSWPPCDAPFLQPGLYDALIDAIGTYDAAVPRLEAIDPLRAVYRREAALHVLRSRPAIPSPSALVDRLDSCFVDVARLRRVDPHLASFLDVNTAQDYGRATRLQDRVRRGPVGRLTAIPRRTPGK